MKRRQEHDLFVAIATLIVSAAILAVGIGIGMKVQKNQSEERK